jgi:hypothetical protein
VEVEAVAVALVTSLVMAVALVAVEEDCQNIYLESKTSAV